MCKTNDRQSAQMLCCPFYTRQFNYHININCQNIIWHSLLLNHHLFGFISHHSHKNGL